MNDIKKYNINLTKNIRDKSPIENRIETGPVQFNDDRPGIFIRGDDAFAIAMNLEILLNEMDSNSTNLMTHIAKNVVKNHIELLRSCIKTNKQL